MHINHDTIAHAAYLISTQPGREHTHLENWLEAEMQLHHQARQAGHKAASTKKTKSTKK